MSEDDRYVGPSFWGQFVATLGIPLLGCFAFALFVWKMEESNEAAMRMDIERLKAEQQQEASDDRDAGR